MLQLTLLLKQAVGTNIAAVMLATGLGGRLLMSLRAVITPRRGLVRRLRLRRFQAR